MSMNPLVVDFLGAPRHHAYLVVGDAEQGYEALRLLIRKKIVAGEIDASDVWSRAYANVSIDDAREIKEVQNTRPIGKRRIVVLSLFSIQNEAQNSLLKLFEEPSSDTVFFICAGNTSIFLPTVLSRFYIVESNLESSGSEAGLLTKFFAGSVSERVALLEPIIKEKDKAEAERFLDSIEATLYKNKKAIDSNSRVFEDIFSARRFLRGRSPSVKMILEHLCGIVPSIQVTKKI